MFESAIAELRSDARRRFGRAAANLKKETSDRAKRSLPFKPKSKIRTYHSKRRFASTVSIPAVYLRAYRERASRILTLPPAQKFNLPAVTSTDKLTILMKKEKNLRLSSDKQYVLYWKNNKSYPCYQINNLRNTPSLSERAKRLLEQEF